MRADICYAGNSTKSSQIRRCCELAVLADFGEPSSDIAPPSFGRCYELALPRARHPFFTGSASSAWIRKH